MVGQLVYARLLLRFLVIVFFFFFFFFFFQQSFAIHDVVMPQC